MKRNSIVMLLVVALVVAIGALCLAGCGEGYDLKHNDKGDVKITFVLDWAPNTNHTGLYVAKDLGYFAEEGLAVEFIQPGNAGASTLVASGSGEFGIDFQEQMIFNERQNINVTAVGSIIQHNTSGILSPLDRNITSAADMAGKKYATWGMQGEQAIIKAMLKNANVDPSTLNMVPKYVENIAAEFADPNGVDCVWSYGAWDKIIYEKGGGTGNFIEMRDIEGLDYYTPVIIANNDLIKYHPEVVEKFMRAASRGYNYAIENPKLAVDALLRQNPEMEIGTDILYASQEFLAGEYKSDAPYWGYIDAARWDGFFNLMCSLGEEEFPTDITDGYGFTNEFLPTK